MESIQDLYDIYSYSTTAKVIPNVISLNPLLVTDYLN